MKQNTHDNPKRDGSGRYVTGNSAFFFGEGNKAALKNRGGRPTSEVKAQLREAGLEALPRIREIAGDPKHKDHFRANTWLAERGLKDEIEARENPVGEGLGLPQWEQPPEGTA